VRTSAIWIDVRLEEFTVPVGPWRRRPVDRFEAADVEHNRRFAMWRAPEEVPGLMKKIASALAIAGACLFSTGAMAQAYVSGAIGASEVDLDCEGAATCDTKDTAFKLVGGYDFGNGFAAELGYADFGKAKAADGGISAELKASGITLGVAYQAQFNQDWGMNLRAGIINVKAEISGTVAGVGSASDDDTTTQPYFGIAVNYALAKNVKLELGADFTKAEYAGEKADVRAVSIGVRYAF
jgi:OmpA-OmpF porin, OOP family